MKYDPIKYAATKPEESAHPELWEGLVSPRSLRTLTKEEIEAIVQDPLAPFRGKVNEI